METPSSSCQFKLAERLVGEMKELGIEDAAVDGKCYVYGTIPATEGYGEQSISWIYRTYGHRFRIYGKSDPSGSS